MRRLIYCNTKSIDGMCFTTLQKIKQTLAYINENTKFHIVHVIFSRKDLEVTNNYLFSVIPIYSYIKIN